MSISRTLLTFLIFLIFPQIPQAAEYPINTGDEIKVIVSQYDEFNTTEVLSESGKLLIPIVGEIELQGKTESEAKKLIGNALVKGQLVSKLPKISVVVQYNSRKASIIGRVHNPGQYLITTGESILEFISKAGGLKDDGSSIVTLYRNQGDPVYIDLFASTGAKINRNSPITSGDIIRVTEAEAFFTSGEVNKPNKYPLSENMTIRQAVSVSGGMTEKATEKGLRVIRKAPDGSLVNREAKMDEIVQSEDIIFVKESLF